MEYLSGVQWLRCEDCWVAAVAAAGNCRGHWNRTANSKVGGIEQERLAQNPALVPHDLKGKTRVHQ